MSQSMEAADLRKLMELEAERASLTADTPNGHTPLWVRIGDYFVKHLRQPVTISRKKYLILALTCGWFCGAHRFYANEKGWALLYLLTSWTGIAAAMTIVDLVLLWLKYEPDENGMIVM